MEIRTSVKGATRRFSLDEYNRRLAQNPNFENEPLYSGWWWVLAALIVITARTLLFP